MKKALLFIFGIALCFSLAAPVNSAITDGKYYVNLKNIYDSKNPKLNDYLLEECENFLSIYGSGPMAAEVRYVMGLIYEEKGDYPKAVATYLKGLFLDPVSERMNDERMRIKDIISREKHFKKIASKIESATEGPFVEKSLADKYLDYLNAVYEINDSSLYKSFIKEARYFISSFPKNADVEKILSKVARVYWYDSRFEEAIASYQKIESLFPESPATADYRLTVAKIRYFDLKDYGKAKDEFKLITQAYPGKEAAGDAYFYLAELYYSKLKNPNEALENYQTVASQYQRNPYAVESLFRVSDIYIRDFNNNDKAIEVLNQINKNFSTNERAPESMDDIASIYSNRMKDYDSAITTYKKLAETYPSSSIASKRLFEAAKIAEGKLKDFGNALTLYQDVVNMFPDSSEAKKASKKIPELKKKAGQ